MNTHAASIFPLPMPHVVVGEGDHANVLHLRAAGAAPHAGRKEAVFIEAGLDGRQALVEGTPPGIAVAALGGEHDGLVQLARWAASASDVDVLHLLCHGAPGRLMLGTRELDRQALADPQVGDALAAIGLSLRTGGAVLLYGCNVAQGPEGAAFVAELALLLGVPVAASASVIGAAPGGANWVLEHATATLPGLALAWPAYAGTLTIANEVTDFATITQVIYQQLPQNYPAGSILSQADINGSGWDVSAQSSKPANPFAIRGVNGGNNGDGDTTSIRFQAADVDYVTFKSNANGFYFDLTSFAVRNQDIANFTVQALDRSGNPVGTAVAFSIPAVMAGTGSFSTISLAGNPDFLGIYGFRVNFTTGSDAPFFDSIIVDNIGIPAVPTTTVATAALSDDTGISDVDFITKVASQTIDGTLSAALVAGEKVQVSYDDGQSWSDATNYSVGSTSWSTGTTLSGSSTFQARVTNSDGSSAAFEQNYTLDTAEPLPPSAPDMRALDDSGGSSSDNITKVTAPIFSGTAEAGATVTLYAGDTEIGSTVATDGVWSITSTVLAQGSHEITVKATDIAGNESDASNTLNVVIDTTAPAGMALSTTSAAVANAISGATLATLSATDSTAVTYALAAGDGTNNADNGSFAIVNNKLNVGDAALAAGNYQVYLSATDAAGNISYLAQTITVQNAPSVTSIVRAGGAGSGVPASATSASYTVTFSDSVTGVDIGDFVLTGSDSASGTLLNITGSGTTYTVTVTDLAGDGTLRLDLKASGTGIESSGGVAIGGGYTSGATYLLDHTAPAAPSTPDLRAADDSGSANNDNITAVTTPTFSGTAEAGATITLYAGDTEIGSAVATGGVWSITSTTLPQGTHEITVKATDAAGNASNASNALSVVIDTAAPTGLALSTTSAAVANAISGATLATLAATDSTTLTYALAAGNGTNNAHNGSFAIVDNKLNVGGTALATGSYQVYLSATDAAGNVSYLAQTITVQSIPVVTSIVRADDADSGLPADATSASYTVTFSENVTGVDIGDFVLTGSESASGTVTEVSGSGSTYTVTVTNLAGDGTLRLDLKGSGTGIESSGGIAIGGGYTSGDSYLLDHTAPDAPATPGLAPGNDSGVSDSDNITKLTTPTFSGSAADGTIITLYQGDTEIGSGVAIGGVWTITSSALIDGTYDITVKATDAAGNASPASSALVVTVDTSVAAPAALALDSGSDSGAAGDGITNIAKPIISGTAEAYADVTLYDTDGITVLGTAKASATGAWRIETSLLLDGSHTVTAVQIDRAGNTSTVSEGLRLTINTQPPAAPGMPSLAPASDTGTVGDNATQATRPVISGTALPNAVVKLYDSNGSTVLGTVTADINGNWSITSTTLSTGVHTLTVKQLDAAGNESTASAPLSLTIQAQPSTPTNPPTTPPPVIDGVPVQTQPVTLPGGGSGTQIVIPVITPGRDETSGNADVADIPLATSGGSNLLLAQLPAGFGLSAVGGASRPAGDPIQQLIAAIVAATPGHAAGDQGHLVGNGSDFLGLLNSSTPLLVQTITPTATTAPSQALTLTGTSNAGQRTALVIDASDLPAGSQLVLNAVDFAAIIGSANITVGTASQVITGDAASQSITVSTTNHGAVFAGGGSDTLAFGQPSSATGNSLRAGAADEAGTTLLHGGAGQDRAVFAGKLADYTIARHEGYLVVAAKAQPEQQALLINVEHLQFDDTTVAVEYRAAQGAIAGLYREVLDRQADYLGIDFWTTAEKNGMSLGKIAIELIMSAEAQALDTGAFNGNAGHDVEILYQSIFGRHSDAEGLAFWTGAMARGVTLEGVASAFMQSDELEVHKIGVQDWDFLVG